MAKAKAKNKQRSASGLLSTGTVAENRKAHFNFEITEVFNAGLALTGTEVKSLRMGKANIAESYATIENDQVVLLNADIPVYAMGNIHNHHPRRPRILLMHRKEIDRLAGAIQRSGMTLVPMKLYFNDRGLAKLQLGLAKGKNTVDKRETEKKRDWDRQKARIMRELG